MILLEDVFPMKVSIGASVLCLGIGQCIPKEEFPSSFESIKLI